MSLGSHEVRRVDRQRASIARGDDGTHWQIWAEPPAATTPSLTDSATATKRDG